MVRICNAMFTGQPHSPRYPGRTSHRRNGRRTGNVAHRDRLVGTVRPSTGRQSVFTPSTRTRQLGENNDLRQLTDRSGSGRPGPLRIRPLRRRTRRSRTPDSSRTDSSPRSTAPSPAASSSPRSTAPSQRPARRPAAVRIAAVRRTAGRSSLRLPAGRFPVWCAAAGRKPRMALRRGGAYGGAYGAAPMGAGSITTTVPGGPQQMGPDGEPALSQPLYGATFMQATKRFFKKYARFSGYSSLSEHWWAYLTLSLLMLIRLRSRSSSGTSWCRRARPRWIPTRPAFPPAWAQAASSS